MQSGSVVATHGLILHTSRSPRFDLNNYTLMMQSLEYRRLQSGSAFDTV
jgi:hypothetical protein